jgi:hypothetical protein
MFTMDRHQYRPPSSSFSNIPGGGVSGNNSSNNSNMADLMRNIDPNHAGSGYTGTHYTGSHNDQHHYHDDLIDDEDEEDGDGNSNYEAESVPMMMTSPPQVNHTHHHIHTNNINHTTGGRGGQRPAVASQTPPSSSSFQQQQQRDSDYCGSSSRGPYGAPPDSTGGVPPSAVAAATTTRISRGSSDDTSGFSSSPYNNHYTAVDSRPNLKHYPSEDNASGGDDDVNSSRFDEYEQQQQFSQHPHQNMRSEGNRFDEAHMSFDPQRQHQSSFPIPNASSSQSSAGSSGAARPYPLAGPPAEPTAKAVEHKLPSSKLGRRCLTDRPKRQPDRVAGTIVNNPPSTVGTPTMASPIDSLQQFRIQCIGCNTVLQVPKSTIVVECPNCQEIHPTAKCILIGGGSDSSGGANR